MSNIIFKQKPCYLKIGENIDILSTGIFLAFFKSPNSV